jgi:hypothetical protein
LQGNNVTNTKSLNKLLFEKLERLDLSKNFFPNVDTVRFKSKNNKFALDFLMHEREREIQSISFYSKFERKLFTENMRSTFNSFSGVKPSFAVVQRHVIRALKRKFN